MGRRRPVVGCGQRTVEGYSLTLSFLEDVARPFGFDFCVCGFCVVHAATASAAAWATAPGTTMTGHGANARQ